MVSIVKNVPALKLELINYPSISLSSVPYAELKEIGFVSYTFFSIIIWKIGYLSCP